MINAILVQQVNVIPTLAMTYQDYECHKIIFLEQNIAPPHESESGIINKFEQMKKEMFQITNTLICLQISQAHNSNLFIASE